MAASKKVAKPKAIIRNFDGLRDVLFDQLEGLINGSTKPETANSVARVSDMIIKSVSAQADLMRMASLKRLASDVVPGISMSEK